VAEPVGRPARDAGAVGLGTVVGVVGGAEVEVARGAEDVEDAEDAVLVGTEDVEPVPVEAAGEPPGVGPPDEQAPRASAPTAAARPSARAAEPGPDTATSTGRCPEPTHATCAAPGPRRGLPEAVEKVHPDGNIGPRHEVESGERKICERGFDNDGPTGAD
jgi:hypothetical protein